MVEMASHKNEITTGDKLCNSSNPRTSTEDRPLSYPGKNSNHAPISSRFLSNAPVLNIAAHARLYDKSLTSLIGEKINKLMSGCRCLYINGGVLMGIPLLVDNPMYSISKDKRQHCRLVGTAKGLLRRFMKNSNDPSNTLGTARCKKIIKKPLSEIIRE